MWNWAGPALLDAAEVRRTDGDLLLLDASGGLWCLNSDSGVTVPVGAVALTQPTDDDASAFGFFAGWRLHASADGAFAAVVHDGGQRGWVLDLRDFRCTMELDGGDYHENTVLFSLCFLSFGGRSFVVHRTAWNRLDASDPATGTLLTERTPTSYEEGQRPVHYLDYFHGQLIPNPSQTHLLNDGWVWHPVGVPRVFDVHRWLGGHVWEAEDGPSVRELCFQDDWNLSACWLDDTRVVLAGTGDGDEDEGASLPASPGVRIIDVRDARNAPHRKLAMPEPVHRLFADGDTLWAAHARSTTAWSVTTGACQGVWDGFAATHFHRARRALLSLQADGIRTMPLS